LAVEDSSLPIGRSYRAVSCYSLASRCLVVFPRFEFVDARVAAMKVDCACVSKAGDMAVVVALFSGHLASEG
jgi:hypothetical protein